MIRVPRGGFLDRSSLNLARSSANLAIAEEQATTGLRLNRPSDAPGIVREAARLDASSADQTIWQENASGAMSLHDAMDTALGSASDLVVRLREIAVAGASDTLDADGRAALGAEASQLLLSLQQTANTEFAGRYVFAGTAYDTPPFDATNTYVGSTDVPETRIGEDRWVQTGMDGSAVFNGAVDIFGTVQALADALNANDAATTGTLLGNLDTITQTLSTARGQVGAWTNAADDAATVASSMDVVLSERVTNLVEVDPAEAYLRLTELRSSYQAAIQVAGSASNQTLLDYLR